MFILSEPLSFLSHFLFDSSSFIPVSSSSQWSSQWLLWKPLIMTLDGSSPLVHSIVSAASYHHRPLQISVALLFGTYGSNIQKKKKKEKKQTKVKLQSAMYTTSNHIHVTNSGKQIANSTNESTKNTSAPKYSPLPRTGIRNMV